MLLVVDANILVGEALRRRGRRSMDDSRLELLMAESAASETAHELGQRVEAIERHGHLSVEQAQALRTAALAVALTANEFARSCNLGPRDWLYVVYDCAQPNPSLLPIQDPFQKPLFRATTAMQVGEGDLLAAAERDGS